MPRFLRVGLLLLSLQSLALAQIAPVPKQVQQDTDQQGDSRPQPNSQQVAIATPVPTIPQTRPMGPPPRSNPAVNPSPAGSDLVKLQFPNSDVDDVLRLYEQLTGKKLVRDNFVQGKVNIFISKDVPREEAIKIIEMNLLMNGFSLIPADEDIVKVIGTGKNPRTTGVPIISDPAQIPEGDHVISFLFKLRYADPAELQQVLGQYLSPPQTYTSFLALPKSSSLLITENSSVIRTISKIIDQVDIPPAEVVSEFVPLQRADASKVVDMLKDIFEKGQQQVPGQTLPGGVRPVRQAAIPQQPSPESDVGSLTALSEDSIVVGKIKLSADVRTNRIHVITRPINMPFVRKLIAEFDANVEFAKPVTRALRYISAGDVLPVLVQSLTEPGTQQAGGGDQTGANGAGANQRNQQNPRTANNTNNTSSTSSSSSSSDSSSLNVSEELSTTPVDTTPKAVTVGNAKIIADQRANAIIVLGNREVVVKVQKILDEMDVKAPQVALSTIIGELTLSNNEEFGVDYFGKYKNKVVGTSSNTGVAIPGLTALPSASPAASVATGAILDPSNLINFSSIIQNVGNGTNVYVAAGNYLSAIVHALEATGRLKVISRPTVFTSNNKKAIIASGQEIPVPVSTLTNAATTVGTTGVAAVASNIEFKKVALQLEVVPLINSEKEVSLDILQKIDSIGGSTVVDGNAIPTINTRYIRTNVSAPNGCTIVLGGLIQDTKSKDTTGIPIMGRLPLIGALFRSTTSSKMRTELIILMRPEVTLTQLDMFRLRQKSEEHTHFGPEIDQTDCPDCPAQTGEDKQVSGGAKEMAEPDLPAN